VRIALLLLITSIAHAQGVRLEGDLIAHDAIRFDYDDATIRPEAMPIIDALAAFITEHAELGTVEIGGHTDAAYYEEYRSRRLERDRAQAVMEALVARGVPRERLRAEGYGATRPLVQCNARRLSPRRLRQCRMRNVRIELRVHAP
jgi:OmpA-OmpF porin, OOP family